MKIPVKFKLLLLLSAVAMFAADFAMKRYAYMNFNTPELVFQTPFGVDFYFHCVTNKGAAWGLLSSFAFPLLIFRIGVVASLVTYIAVFCRSKLLAVILTSITVGAFGNVFDCLYYGFVIDMFHFIFGGNSFGIFNLADVWIFLGTIELIFYFSVLKKDKVKNGTRSS